MKTNDVFPGSANLVEGRLPPSSLLLMGPTGVGKTIFCKQFLFNGLVEGEQGIYVSTDESPEEIEKSMKSYGFDVEPFKKNDMFRIVDCHSWKTGGASSTKYVVSNPADLALLSKVVENATEGLGKKRVVFDSLTGMMSICNHNLTYFSKFLQIIVAKIRTTNSLGIFATAPEAHDTQFISYMRQIFDGTLEMKEDESGRDIKRLLRVFSLKGAKHKTIWTPFEITNKGIAVRSEAELRCVNCGRVIEWEPHTEVINGRAYNFDSADCAGTYRSLKSVYGESFE